MAGQHFTGGYDSWHDGEALMIETTERMLAEVIRGKFILRQTTGAWFDILG